MPSHGQKFLQTGEHTYRPRWRTALALLDTRPLGLSGPELKRFTWDLCSALRDFHEENKGLAHEYLDLGSILIHGNDPATCALSVIRRSAGGGGGAATAAAAGGANPITANVSENAPACSNQPGTTTPATPATTTTTAPSAGTGNGGDLDTPIHPRAGSDRHTTNRSSAAANRNYGSRAHNSNCSSCSCGTDVSSASASVYTSGSGCSGGGGSSSSRGGDDDARTAAVAADGRGWCRAPEQELGLSPISPATDIFSLGCILAEVATGQPLFPGRSTKDRLHRVMRLLRPMGRRLRPGLGPDRDRERAELAADGGATGSMDWNGSPVEAGAQGDSGGAPVRLLRWWLLRQMVLGSETPGAVPRTALVKGSTAAAVAEGELFVDLVESCLQLDPMCRPTAEQLLQMPYLVSYKAAEAAAGGRNNVDPMLGGSENTAEAAAATATAVTKAKARAVACADAAAAAAAAECPSSLFMNASPPQDIASAGQESFVPCTPSDFAAAAATATAAASSWRATSEVLFVAKVHDTAPSPTGMYDSSRTRRQMSRLGSSVEQVVEPPPPSCPAAAAEGTPSGGGSSSTAAVSAHQLRPDSTNFFAAAAVDTFQLKGGTAAVPAAAAAATSSNAPWPPSSAAATGRSAPHASHLLRDVKYGIKVGDAGAAVASDAEQEAVAGGRDMWPTLSRMQPWSGKLADSGGGGSSGSRGPLPRLLNVLQRELIAQQQHLPMYSSVGGGSGGGGSTFPRSYTLSDRELMHTLPEVAESRGCSEVLLPAIASAKHTASGGNDAAAAAIPELPPPDLQHQTASRLAVPNNTVSDCGASCTLNGGGSGGGTLTPAAAAAVKGLAQRAKERFRQYFSDDGSIASAAAAAAAAAGGLGSSGDAAARPSGGNTTGGGGGGGGGGRSARSKRPFMSTISRALKLGSSIRQRVTPERKKEAP